MNSSSFLYLLFLLLQSFQLAHFTHILFEQVKSPKIFPVFHNVIIENIPKVCKIMESLPCGSISLRHTDSIEVLLRLDSILQEKKSKIYLGASSVESIQQLDRFVTPNSRIKYISTMNFNDNVIGHAKKLKIPIICGVNSLETANLALNQKVDALKFFPLKDLGLEKILSIIRQISLPTDYDCNIFLAGGINIQNIEDISLRVKDVEKEKKIMINYLVGFDCNDISSIGSILNSYKEKLSNIN